MLLLDHVLLLQQLLLLEPLLLYSLMPSCLGESLWKNRPAGVHLVERGRVLDPGDGVAELQVVETLGEGGRDLRRVELCILS